MNANLGTKRQCPECAAKFFDLNAATVSCPKCSHELKLSKQTKSVAKLKAVQKVVAKKPKPVHDDYDDEFDMIEGMNEVIELEELDEFDDDLDHLDEVEEHHEDAEVSLSSDDAEDGMFIDEIPASEMKLVDSLEDEDDTVESRDAI